MIKLPKAVLEQARISRVSRTQYSKMATCEYERQREQRIADNRRRMEEMGIFEVCPGGSLMICGSLMLAPESSLSALPFAM